METVKSEEEFVEEMVKLVGGYRRGDIRYEVEHTGRRRGRASSVS